MPIGASHQPTDGSRTLEGNVHVIAPKDGRHSMTDATAEAAAAAGMAAVALRRACLLAAFTVVSRPPPPLQLLLWMA